MQTSIKHHRVTGWGEVEKEKGEKKTTTNDEVLHPSSQSFKIEPKVLPLNAVSTVAV